MQACSDTFKAPTSEWRMIIVRNDTKVLCRFMQDNYYTNSNNNFIVGINLIAVNCSSGSKS